MGEIITRAAVQLHHLVILAGDYSEAIVFDLMEPHLARRRERRRCGKAGLYEARRQVTQMQRHNARLNRRAARTSNQCDTLCQFPRNRALVSSNVAVRPLVYTRLMPKNNYRRLKALHVCFHWLRTFQTSTQRTCGLIAQKCVGHHIARAGKRVGCPSPEAGLAEGP